MLPRSSVRVCEDRGIKCAPAGRVSYGYAYILTPYNAGRRYDEALRSTAGPCMQACTDTSTLTMHRTCSRAIRCEHVINALIRFDRMHHQLLKPRIVSMDLHPLAFIHADIR